MTRPATDPDKHATARRAAWRAVIGLARDRGAELTTRPIFPGSELARPDLDPLDGTRAARDIELGARHTARDYIRAAREAGHSWDQIGHALGLAPDAASRGDAVTVAEAAYTHAAGDPTTETAIRYGRTFPWRCPSCSQAISDQGLIAGPADNEPGHASGCARLDAAVAEWDASWEAEP